MTAYPLDSLAPSVPPAARFLPLRPPDVLSSEAYERIRPRYLRLMTELRRHRRVRIAPEVVLLFESRETVLAQIHEVLRVDGHTPEHVERELSQYDCLVPRPGELRATAMIDGGSRSRGRALATALRRPGAVTLSVDGIRCDSQLAAPGDDDDDPVQYLRFGVELGFTSALRRRDAAVGITTHLPPCMRLTFAAPSLRDQLRDQLGAPPPRTLLHTLAACPWMLTLPETTPS
ncbi:DUF3501 family protein [Paraliomyxa miuraensis]|uniref:DUF3501 family protein n=1 Tax=Paraliomyxa miuraensis TaxID=376150 RepID=UPI002258A545|nr:DUF3501 family protein [Paraliomyxa miuraensis]MCX4241050.1 DUF3501 family protein [Paraliomyxa miuraensis]